MKRRKYKRGKKIRSVDELLKQDFVWFEFYHNGHKIYHKGWVRGWQLGWASAHLNMMYKVKESNDGER